jgi:antitoxin ParD1/3/4
MRSTVNISLPESLKAWLDEQVAKGGYGTVSEYFRQLLREEQKRRLREEIDAKLLASLDSGPSTPMTAEDWEDLRRKVRQVRKSRKAE